jgi:hypothetical protein
MLIHIQNGQVVIIFNALEATVEYACFMSMSLFYLALFKSFLGSCRQIKGLCHRLICYQNILFDDGPCIRPHQPQSCKSSGVLADFLDCFILIMKELQSFTESGITHLITQHHNALSLRSFATLLWEHRILDIHLLPNPYLLFLYGHHLISPGNK